MRPGELVQNLCPVATMLRMAAVLLAVGSGVGCDGRPAPVAGGAPSALALGTAVALALAADDGPALQALALSEDEFRQHVWPWLPAARPERNLPFGYVWSDLQQKSQASLAGLRHRHRGSRWSVRRVTLGPRSVFGQATVHREARLTVQRMDGTVEELRLCGSMLEQSGRWKVFSYVVDD